MSITTSEKESNERIRKSGDDERRRCEEEKTKPMRNRRQVKWSVDNLNEICREKNEACEDNGIVTCMSVIRFDTEEREWAWARRDVKS